MKRIKWGKLLACLAIPLAVGGFAALLTGDGFETYTLVTKPALAPPAIVFPIVWTLLYILMGISCYLICQPRIVSKERKKALIVYGAQLFVNFIWPLVFFGLKAYLAAFLLLILLLVLVVYMVIMFSKINKTAALIQIPYIAWLVFAGYLNISVYLLNR